MINRLRSLLGPYWQLALTVTVALVVVLVALFVWVLPENHRDAQLTSELHQFQAQETTLENQLRVLVNDAHNRKQNCTAYTRLLQEIPPALDEQQFVQDIDSLAVAAGDTSIPSLTWGASSDVMGLPAVQVTLTLDGTLNELLSFMKGLDGSSFPRLFLTTSFSIGTNGSPAGARAGATPIGAGNVNGSQVQPVVSGHQFIASSGSSYQVTIDGNIFYDPSEPNPCHAVIS